MQESNGFESVLEKLQVEAAAGGLMERDRYRDMQSAVAASFRAMNIALANRIDFNFSNNRKYSVNAFLARFDAIYTLNHDLLLELHYDPSLESPRRWNSPFYPGVSGYLSRSNFKSDVVDQKRKALGTIQDASGCQPIYNLHGSSDWQDESGDLFAIGGAKESFIQRKPLLVAYFADFARRLRERGARIMIIGYGFADEHINQALVDARKENQSLGVFFVHPDGRDAIHRGARAQDRALPQYVPPLGYLACIGESRRPLSSTMRDDELEFDKLMRFFT